MSRKNIFEMNYHRLEELLGQPPEKIDPARTYRLRSPSECFMDLVVEKISPSPTKGATLISLAHYFRSHGDLCQDPEVVVRIFPPGSEDHQEFAPSTDKRHGRMEAILFQQAVPSIFHAVYPEPGRYSPRLKKDLNGFLTTWLRNLKNQGHKFIDDDEGEERTIPEV